MDIHRKAIVTIPVVSAYTLIELLSDEEPKSAAELLLREQPNLIETFQHGWPQDELEGALWAAALCYSAIKRQLNGDAIFESNEILTEKHE